MAAVHPSGRALVVVNGSNRLSVLDLPSGQIDRTLFVGGVRISLGAQFLLGNDYPRDWLTMPLDAIEDMLRRRLDQLAEARLKIVRSRSTEGASSTERESPSQFHEMGKEIIEAIAAPARIRATESEAREALAAAQNRAGSSKRLARGSALTSLRSTPRANVCSRRPRKGCGFTSGATARKPAPRCRPRFSPSKLTIRFTRRPTAFSASAGRSPPSATTRTATCSCSAAPTAVCRFLDLTTGRTGTLFEPPALRPIRKLAFSRDRTVLGAACGTDMIEDGSARPMRCSAAVQFWNYRAVCDSVSAAEPEALRRR